MHKWNWRIFLESSPDGQGTYLDTLISGLGWTIATALAAWVFALAIGIAVGTLRTLPNTLARRAADIYIEPFRNIPLLVQMFLWYFVVPELVPTEFGTWLKSIPTSSFLTAVVALAFYTSASVAVLVAAGIEALPVGQKMAGTALGLTLPQTYRHVLLPMAFRVIVPSLTNDCTSAIKNSSVALTIGLLELTSRARSMAEFSFYVFEPFAAATLGYLIANTVIVVAMRVIEHKIAVPGTLHAIPDKETGADKSADATGGDVHAW